MLRGGGGLCIEGPAGSLPRVSPRIRALQDRLLDSLPADGAWECLSPAQREAIISLHRARLTRNIVAHEDCVEVGKRQNRKSKGLAKGFHRYGRSRSYEDKLESETDDSGVRVVGGGGTNSSSTTNSQNSHEDDSSDPGVKRSGRFAKSPSASRFARKEHKSSPEANKQKGVTNGVGNVNKIISKQMGRNCQQAPPTVGYDNRNIALEKLNPRDPRNCSIFDSRQQQYDVKCRRYQNDKMVRHEAISRKNILQRYQDSGPLISKESAFDDYDTTGANFRHTKYDDTGKHRRPSSGADFDYEFDVHRSDSTPSPCGPERGGSAFEAQQPIMKHSMSSELLDSKLKSRPYQKADKNFENIDASVNSKGELGTMLDSKLDYRNKLNQEGSNKYSNNWNSILLKRAFPFKSHNIPSAKCIPPQNQLVSTSLAPHGRSVGNLAHKSEANVKAESKVKADPKLDYVDRGLGKKYIRSKSLDRKYLEETTDDDESDFEIRRRTDRMRRYARANQEWESQKKFVENNAQFLKRNPHLANGTSKPKSKSSWDVSNRIDSTDELSNADERSFFRSRSNILNRWRSEENELSKVGERVDSRNFSRRHYEDYKLRRHSCDFELDASDNDCGGGKVRGESSREFRRKQIQRRSCDFELELMNEEFSDRKYFYDDDWDNSLDAEIKIIEQRSQSSPKTELRKIYPLSHTKEKADPKKFGHDKVPTRVEGPLLSKDIVNMNNSNKFHIRPEISGRKWIRVEDEIRAFPENYPISKNKGKTPHALRGKFRLFKSILPF